MKTLLLQQMGMAALLAGVTTMFVTPVVKRLAVQAGVVRYPRDRDAHTKPTPLWGGVAIVVGFFVAFLVIRVLLGGALPQVHAAGHSGPRPLFGIEPHPILGTLIGATLVAFIGLLDDRIDLSPKLQILGLLLGGFVAAVLGARIDGVTNPISGGYLPLPIWLSISGTMAWAFLATKTFDFLDGLDGLAAGTCAIAAMTMGLMAIQREPTVALLAAALVGSCLGFLRHNYNPASIFMGTVGSYFLGFLLSMLAVTGAFKIPAAISVVVPIFIMGVPIFDALYVVGRRVAEKRAPTAADKTHIHHRLTQSGLSVRKAVWTIYGLTAGTCLLALVLAWKWGR